jgi:hypothetical protein
LYIFMMVFTFSCSSISKKTKKKQIARATIIHPLYFQEELSTFINFPFWFNDSIVKANKIESINHVIYTSMHQDDLENSAPYPKKTIRYTFNKNGYLIHIQYTDYSEGIIISHQSYNIIGTKHPYYTAAIRLDNTLGVENSSYLVVPKKKKKNVLQFDNNSKKERIHFIQKNRFWGPLSVDSIAHPKPTDWVVLGTPYKPEKRFKVKNTVKESDVTTYTYLNDNYPSEIISGDYPFTKKRTFEYSKNGAFLGFVDSTFIDLEFITRSTIRLNYNNKGLPINITKKKGHATGQKVYITKESISYTTF